MGRLAALTAASCLSLLALCGGVAAADGPVTGPVARAGRWIVDDQGRVVIVHGVGIVVKDAPFYPALFGPQDAQFFANEGFTAAREGFIWGGLEPRPGRYDERYIRHELTLNELLAHYGIRSLIDFHQDGWRDANGGDGAPAWASPSSSGADNFQHFWNNDPAPDRVGLQDHYVNTWRHVIRELDASPGARNIWGLDPFNEPQPGSGFPSCSPYVTPCPAFEQGPLAAFYRRLIPALRGTGDHHVIWPEDMATDFPSLPGFRDPQTAYNFHYYCPITQVAVTSGPQDAACQPQDQKIVGGQVAHADGLDVPAMVSEFSSSDANDENAWMTDLMGREKLSWTIWAYYTKDPAGTPTEGLLIDDGKHGSEANAKQPKLDAIVVPYPQAIAGTPGSYGYDRTSGVMTLSYRARAVPGAHLAPGALTQIFVPRRHYAHGYRVSASGASVVSPPTSPWVQLMAHPGARVKVTISPARNSTTRWPLTACPVAAGRLTSRQLGPLMLGFTRTQASRRLETFGASRPNFEDHCVFAGPGIGAGYAAASLIGALPGREQHQLAHRVVLLLTANPYYAFDGARPGERLSPALIRRLRLPRPLRVGGAAWYLVGGGSSVRVLKATGGSIQEVGVAAGQLNRTRARERQFLASFAGI